MVEIDGSELGVREINVQLRRLATEHPDIRLVHPAARHNLGVGLTESVRLTIAGSAGYFCAGLADGPQVRVEGNVGWGFGDNLMNGRLEVLGDAGAVCGIGMRDGAILIRGNIGSRAGQVMKGGSIVCAGNAGFRAGSMMMGGTLIILGDAGDDVGEFMMDGEIYVAGKMPSIGKDAQEVALRPEDAPRVRAILASHEMTFEGTLRKVISDQRALRYATYEDSEQAFEKARQAKAAVAAADGHRDVMSFDAD